MTLHKFLFALFLVTCIDTSYATYKGGTGGDQTRIITKVGDLRLEGTGKYVKVKADNEDRDASQLWMPESLTVGKFHIVNKESGKVLDIEGGALDGNKVITSERDYNKATQEWYINSNGAIVHVNRSGQGLALEVTKNNNVIVKAFNDSEEKQKFYLYHSIVLD